VSLGRAIDEAGLPLHVQTVEWSHGYGRIFADHMDHCHARNEGRKLAEQIACYQRPRADGPPLPVYLVAHAGAAPWHWRDGVPPPNAVERIVLLARRCRRSMTCAASLCRLGVDVFHSQRDGLCWGLALASSGTADRRWDRGCGTRCFRRRGRLARCGAVLKLRQHPWGRVSAGPATRAATKALTTSNSSVPTFSAAFRTGSVNRFPYFCRFRGRFQFSQPSPPASLGANRVVRCP